MNERLKELRSKLNLSQVEFSERILVGSSTLAMWELGSRKIKDIHISKICSEFRVNEEWFRYGIGDMFLPNADEELESLSRKYNLDPMSKAFIKEFAELNELEKKVIFDVFMKISKGIKNSIPE